MEQHEMAQEAVAEQIAGEQHQLCPSPQGSAGGGHTVGPLSRGLEAEHLGVQHAAPKSHHQAHAKHGGSSRKHRRDGGGHRVHTKKGAWTEEEEMVLATHHREIGNKWAAIAKFLPARTDNDVKNHWNSTLRSKSALKHTTFLWLYAKEVEYVADSETARVRSFDHALGVYEELRDQALAAAEEQAALDDGTQPELLQPQPTWACTDEGAEAALLPGVQPVAGQHGCIVSQHMAPVPAPPVMRVKQEYTAGVEADTEDSQTEHGAVAPCSLRGNAQCSTAARLAAGDAYCRASNCNVMKHTGCGVEMGVMDGAYESALAPAPWGVGSMSNVDNDGDATDSEGLLLVMPSTSPAPCSLNELSQDLALQDMSDLVQDPNLEANSGPSLRPHQAPWHAKGSFLAASRDGSDSPSDSRAPTACWGTAQVDTACGRRQQQQQQHGMPYLAGLAPAASATFHTASSSFPSPSNRGRAASPSPAPPGATPAGMHSGKWLMNSNEGSGSESGLPPGLNMDVIAMDLQDHTFDNLDVTTFLHQSSTTQNNKVDLLAAKGLGAGPVSSASHVSTQSAAPAPLSAQPFRWPDNGNCDNFAYSQHLAKLLGLSSETEQAQQFGKVVDVPATEQDMGEDDEMLPCSRLLAVTPQPCRTPAVPLPPDPLMLTALPTCNTNSRKEGPFAAAAATASEEPASSRSLSTSNCTTTTPLQCTARLQQQASPFMQASSHSSLLQAQHQPMSASVGMQTAGTARSASMASQHHTALAWPRSAAPCSPVAAARSAVLEVPAVGNGPWDADTAATSMAHFAGMSSAACVAANMMDGGMLMDGGACVSDGVVVGSGAAGPPSNSASPSRNGSSSPAPSPWVASSARAQATQAKAAAPATGSRSWSQQLQQVQQLLAQAPAFKTCAVKEEEQEDARMDMSRSAAGLDDWGVSHTFRGRPARDTLHGHQAGQPMLRGYHSLAAPMAAIPDSPTFSHCGKRKSDDFAVARPVGAGSGRYVRSCINKASHPQGHARLSLDTVLGMASQQRDHDVQYLVNSGARSCWAKPGLVDSPTAACMPPGNHSFSMGLNATFSTGPSSLSRYAVHSIQEGEASTDPAYFGLGCTAGAAGYPGDSVDPSAGWDMQYNSSDLKLSALASQHLSLKGAEEQCMPSQMGQMCYGGTRVIIHKPPARMSK